jgi:hypothetical protein
MHVTDQAVFRLRKVLEPARNGHNSLVSAAKVELEAYEATHGARKLVRYAAESECPECGGTGELREATLERWDASGPRPCDKCHGTGLVLGERLLRVRLPPGIEDGDQVRVAGEDHAVLLDVVVRPEPRDPRLVRYLALAGMLAAAALLVAYVLLS